MTVLNKLKKILGVGSNNLQTFTYFIPAPPARKTGYREKNFDNMINELSKLGFDIVDIRTQSISAQDQSGMWVILTLRPLTKKSSLLRPSEFPKEFSSVIQTAPMKEDTLPSTNNSKSIDLPQDEDGEDVKGIYYID
jgi:hypothetical protein